MTPIPVSLAVEGPLDEQVLRQLLRQSVKPFAPGVSVSKVPFRPEECDDPKLVLINLARQSRKRNIRDDIPPLPGSTSKIGKNYVGQLAHFVTTEWRVNDIARSHSPSLDGAIRALEKFVAHFS